jgi:hypothetical protein
MLTALTKMANVNKINFPTFELSLFSMYFDQLQYCGRFNVITPTERMF